jgi:methionine-rich copper-binding protein CopC
MITRHLAAACAAAALSLFGSVALAHAMLEHAEPRVGSTVHEAPRSVRLAFSERLEPAFSRIGVEDTSGRKVDAGDGHVDAADASVLAVSLPALAPGIYRVRWRVVSVDTHVTEGDFTFTIAR